MMDLFKNQIFYAGFFCGVFIFFTLNYLSYLYADDYSLDSGMHFTCGNYFVGFPLFMYNKGLINPSGSSIIWDGLILNILIALVFSFILGLIFKFIWSKFFSRRLSLK